MDLLFFFKGIVLGIAIAAPVGPIAILCIRRTLQYGRWSGLFSGLGAAAADTFYGTIAAFGLSFVATILTDQEFLLRLAGGAFLAYMGVRTFFSKKMTKLDMAVSHSTLISDFFSTFFLTLSNPITVFSFFAIFAALGLTHEEKLLQTISLILGIFLGSSGWWCIVSEGISFFRKRLTQSIMAWVNRIAGLLIVGFALLVWLSILHTR